MTKYYYQQYGDAATTWRPSQRSLMVALAASLAACVVCGAALLVRFLPAATGLASAPLRLVVDTDAGTDDAMALFLALGRAARRPDLVDLAAVTCVHGNTALHNVVQNVLKVLQTAGRLDVPVYAGAAMSILVTPPSDNYYGKDGFGDVPYSDPPDPAAYLRKGHGANALVDLVNQHPGEITLVCLGPLTNVALAIRLDPEFLTKVKQVVILGGSAQGLGNIIPGVEFNFYMDPEADFIVLNSTDTSKKEGIRPVDLLPWETIKKNLNISMEWRVKTLGAVNSPAVRLLNAAEREHLNPAPGSSWSSADPVAMAVALYPDAVRRGDTYHADVETQGVVARGALFVDYGDLVGRPANVHLVQQVDQEAFQGILLENLS